MSAVASAATVASSATLRWKAWRTVTPSTSPASTSS